MKSFKPSTATEMANHGIYLGYGGRVLLNQGEAWVTMLQDTLLRSMPRTAVKGLR